MNRVPVWDFAGTLGLPDNEDTSVQPYQKALNDNMYLMDASSVPFMQESKQLSKLLPVNLAYLLVY